MSGQWTENRVLGTARKLGKGHVEEAVRLQKDGVVRRGIRCHFEGDSRRIVVKTSLSESVLGTGAR